MGRGVIERDIIHEIPDKSAEMILYCGGGYRSAMAADNLQKMGYTNVFSLAGGWRAWQESEDADRGGSHRMTEGAKIVQDQAGGYAK